MTAVYLVNTTLTSIPLYNDSTPVASIDSNTAPTPLETRILITALTSKDPRHNKILLLGAWVYYHLNGLHALMYKLAACVAIRRLIFSASLMNHHVWDLQTNAIFNTTDITPTNIVEHITHDVEDLTPLDKKLTVFSAIK
jgi:hypothetical protein